jgi:hypothetical protein
MAGLAPTLKCSLTRNALVLLLGENFSPAAFSFVLA